MNNILKEGALYKVKNATFTLYSEPWDFYTVATRRAPSSWVGGWTAMGRLVRRPRIYTLKSSDIFFVVEYFCKMPRHHVYCVLFKENIWYLVLLQSAHRDPDAAGYAYSEQHLELLAEAAT
jgi:hypothetical protein